MTFCWNFLKKTYVKISRTTEDYMFQKIEIFGLKNYTNKQNVEYDEAKPGTWNHYLRPNNVL